MLWLHYFAKALSISNANTNWAEIRTFGHKNSCSHCAKWANTIIELWVRSFRWDGFRAKDIFNLYAVFNLDAKIDSARICHDREKVKGAKKKFRD